METDTVAVSFRSDPTIFWASVLIIVCLIVLLLPASVYRPDARPIEYHVEIPHEIRPDTVWDLSNEATGDSQQEVCFIPCVSNDIFDIF